MEYILHYILSGRLMELRELKVKKVGFKHGHWELDRNFSIALIQKEVALYIQMTSAIGTACELTKLNFDDDK